MLKIVVSFLFTLFLATAAYANPKQIVDCQKVASTASAAVYQMHQFGDTKEAAGRVFSALPEVGKKIDMSEADLIVATGIVANFSVFGAKQIYLDLGLTKEAKERKLQATRNIFYMFCENAFRVKNYY